MASNARELAQIPSTPSGRRNLLINGAMQVAQRGTSLTGQTATNAIFTVDRFNTEISGPTSFDIARVTDSPDEFSYSLKVTSNGSFSASANQIIIPFEQRLEGQDLQQLSYGTSSAKSFTVSFHIKSTKTGTYVLQARHSSTAGQERTQAQSYTIDSANTWEKKTITFSGDTNDDIANDNAGRFTLFWWMIAGSTFTGGTLATSWEDSTNANRAVGVASSSADDDSWQITGVQMEVGSVATDFEHQKYCDVYKDCQRYYYKSGDNADSGNEWFPGVATNSGKGVYYAISGSETTDRAYPALQWPVQMRTAPSITFYPGRADTTNTADRITVYNGTGAVTFSTSPTPYSNGLSYHFQGTSSDGIFYSYQIIADAEI